MPAGVGPMRDSDCLFIVRARLIFNFELILYNSNYSIYQFMKIIHLTVMAVNLFCESIGM